MDRGAWQAMVHRVTENGTRLKRLSTHALKDTLIKLTILFIFRTVSDISFIKSIIRGTFLSVQWLRLHASCRGHMFKPSWRNEDPACLVE